MPLPAYFVLCWVWARPEEQVPAFAAEVRVLHGGGVVASPGILPCDVPEAGGSKVPSGYPEVLILVGAPEGQAVVVVVMLEAAHAGCVVLVVDAGVDGGGGCGEGAGVVVGELPFYWPDEEVGEDFCPQFRREGVEAGA